MARTRARDSLLPAEVCRQKMHPKHFIQVVREGLALPQARLIALMTC